MVLTEVKYAHQYYLGKVGQLAANLTDATILKTDLWNEVRLDCPGSGDIIGRMDGVKKTVAVEIVPDRCEKGRRKFLGQPVEIINGDLRTITFDEGQFDAIISLSTLNYMPWNYAKEVIQKFHKWTKTGGWVYFVFWLTAQKSQEIEGWQPNPHAGELFHHNLYDVSRALWENGFDAIEREEIFGSRATPVMVGYICRVVPVPPKPIDIQKALKVFGWMTEPELTWLAKQAREHTTIVELGSYQGRSTRAMGDNTNGTVTAIDHFMGPARMSLTSEQRSNIFTIFCNNNKDLIDAKKVIPVVCDHAEVDLDINPDMVFIDGGHEYEEVKRDILKWQPKLQKGGLLCGHDATQFGVPKALKELFGDNYEIIPHTDIWACS